MSSEGIKSQQKFLQDRGLYHGAIDGEWGNQSIDAMKGWAYRSDSGNLDGSSFQRAPDGHVLVGDVIVEAPAQPAAQHVAAKKGVKQKVKKVVKAVVEAAPDPQLTKRVSGSGKGSFTVTGREGDKPQVMGKVPAKVVKKEAKAPTVIKKPAKVVAKKAAVKKHK